MTAVIVLGGHRCGTSSVAGVIARLGIPVALPGQEIPASPSNPKGHFEDAEFCRLHQLMLGTSGWRDPQPPDRVPGEVQSAYDTHIRRRAAAGRWCVKDPRLCVLLPILLERLAVHGLPARVVSVSRRPRSAAESLRRRQRLNLQTALQIAWTYEGCRRAQVAWIARRPGVELLSLAYEQVMADRTAGVDRLARFLGVAPTPEAVGFLDPELRHF